nr:LOW QUALITY PROTEIN: probable histone-lysine N-methyltransferase Mes-4 [Aedes albopictus]
MGKKVKPRTSRLSLIRSSIDVAGRRSKKVTKMNRVKPTAPGIDIEEMLESSVIFTDDGSSRTRSGLKNGETVQRTPTSKAKEQRKEADASPIGNGSTDIKSPPILTRALRVKIKELSPAKKVVRRSKASMSPSVEISGDVIKDQMTLVLNKIDEPVSEVSVSSAESIEEESKVDSEPEVANSVDPSPPPPDTSPTKAIEDGLKSPQRAKYLLKQLESTLSPKFMKPSKTNTGVSTSRYGRIQKQKENSDYIPLDVARFITKSPAKIKAIKTKLEIEPLSEPVEQLLEGSDQQLPVVEIVEPLPIEADLPSTEVEPLLPPVEDLNKAPEDRTESIESSVPPETPQSIDLSDPPSSVEIVPETPASIVDNVEAMSSPIPVRDPNASLIGIDEIQIIDMDASFGETIVSVASSVPVVEEVIQTPAVSEDIVETPAEPPTTIVAETPPSAVDATGSDSPEFYPGQLLWGAFNAKTPHWPCMVSLEPESGQIRKTHTTRKPMLHVKFFADNGRRAWIPEAMVLPYSTVEHYKSLVDTQFKSIRTKFLQVERRETWLEAVRQADETQKLPLEARENRFQELLEADRAKPKLPGRRRTKSVSLGYHSNSFDESYESGARKRHRSRTPESPAYEPLPLSSNNTENISKRIKLESNEQDLLRNTISRYFQSMADGSDLAETASTTSSDCEDITEMVEFDKEIYTNFLNMTRLLVFEGQTETEVDKKLQKYVQKICALRMHAIANGARLSSRLRSQALRRLGRELGIDGTKKESESPSGSASVEKVRNPNDKRRKKLVMSLEERFIFDLEKNYLMKGVPRGVVCMVCTKPYDLVKCSKCCNQYHLACLTDTPIKSDPAGESKTFTCADCILQKVPACFVCTDNDDTVKEDEKYRCAMSGCGKQYHLACLRLFPQHKFTGTSRKSSTLFCPAHTCHTCVSDDPRSNATTTKGQLVRCIKCPSSYHADAKCIPAGSEILTNAAMICPKHTLEQCSINVNWCFLCCQGGSLICCETCPTAFHLECLKFTPPEGRYICEECESGRMPLYNEVVWAKYGAYRFWPAITVPPPMVPENVELDSHKQWDICIRFFGSSEYVWINRRRIYLYQEGDSDAIGQKRSGLARRYGEALQEAKKVHGMLLEKKTADQLTNGSEDAFKPPMYKNIKSNRYVAPLKAPYQAKDEMEDNVCECKASDNEPCGPDSNCLNRALLVECNPKLCPAGGSCQNQCFEKRQYPALAARRISQKGWGLVAQEDIRQGQFVIEYVGEVINNEELARRLQHKVTQKDENYYFLTVDSELTIDAGPKGNLARFINHSCEPNCETMLWKVGGAQSVGLFAIKDIKAGEELTFNYNFESKGPEKKICHCNASKCSGFIGQKYRPPVEEPSGDGRRKSVKKTKGSKRRKSSMTAADKRRKSTVEKDDGTPGGSKSKKRKSVAVEPVESEGVKVKVEPSEATEAVDESVTTGASMAVTEENPKVDETAIKDEVKE